MTRPLLLDLFCGAGGAAMGYHRAGFDVLGIDIIDQPRYPFDFVQADALEWLSDGKLPSIVAAIHASPPCQDHTPLRAIAGLHGTGWILNATLTALATQPVPWVVENVAGAKMHADLILCGAMFGLRTYRHRRFFIDPRLTILLEQPFHPRHRVRTPTKQRRAGFDAGLNISVTGNVGSYPGPACMGIDWMTGQELAQAVPPAYTHYIGTQLLNTLKGPQWSATNAPSAGAPSKKPATATASNPTTTPPATNAPPAATPSTSP